MMRHNDFRRDYDKFYMESRRTTDWGNLMEDIENKVTFLNQFVCRIPRRPELFGELRRKLEETSEYFKAIRVFTLQNINFNHSVIINDEDISLERAIKRIHRSLSDVGYKFRSVAATKYMHMTCPDLLIMVDAVVGKYLIKERKIAKKFSSAEGYIEALKYYKREIEDLINDVIKTKDENRESALVYIKNIDKSTVRSIPRLIDKHFKGKGSPIKGN